MNIMEIVLLAAGGIVFILSFLIPMKKERSSEETSGLAKEEIKTLVSEELEAVRGHVDDVVEEAVNYSIEKTERSLERLSNEKIMAVNEYSDTVLAEIHKNHEEVMFLYDMLNDKHANLKNTVSEINRTVKEAKATKKEAEEVVNTFQRLAPEAAAPLKAGRINMPQMPAATVQQPAAVQSPMARQQPVMSRKINTPQTPAATVQKPVAAQAPVMAQEPARLVMTTIVQKPVMMQESTAAVMPPAVREPVIMQEPVIPAVIPTVREPVVMQEPVIPAVIPTVREPVVMQEPIIPTASAVVQKSVMAQEPVIPAAPVTVQEQPVMAQEPVMMTAPVMMQEPATTQKAMPVSPQIIASPQVFASAPTPVAVQIPVTPRPYVAPQAYTAQPSVSETVREFESPLPPGGAISFTQETDGQGRNYNDLIMEMYQNGKSNVAIARELNLGVGEVKLVIDLYKNRRER